MTWGDHFFCERFLHTCFDWFPESQGICLAADTLNGVAFGFKCNCTCSDFIGSWFKASLNTFWNLLRMSTESADGLGKELSIIPRRIRSCHKRSTGSARFVVTRLSLIHI